MALRSWSEFPLANPNFIITIIALLLTFFLYLYEFVLRLDRELIVPWLVLTAISYGLCLWSFVAVVGTDPGTVPVYWGVYNNENRERKYCLVCHNFKPDRAHHCSKCRRCVLNMDHHCPWINNCVGFHNRKFFLLFLFYLNLTLALCLPQMVYLMVAEMRDILGGLHSFSFHTALCILVLLACLLLFVSVGYFFFVHVKMALSNITTIEDMLMERRRNANAEDHRLFSDAESNEFDIAPWYNFTQVMGENMFYWPIPVLDELPRGRGLYWDRNNENHYCETAQNSRNKP